jgi:hypothetical protein
MYISNIRATYTYLKNCLSSLTSFYKTIYFPQVTTVWKLEITLHPLGIYHTLLTAVKINWLKTNKCLIKHIPEQTQGFYFYVCYLTVLLVLRLSLPVIYGEKNTQRERERERERERDVLWVINLLIFKKAQQLKVALSNS